MRSFISEDRPVTGEDLNTLRERIGLSVGEACWLYGLSMTKWTNVAKRDAKKMLTNPTLALMTRALSARQDACPLPAAPSAPEVLDLITEIVPGIDKKRFATMFGRESSSGYRWITTQGKISPVLERLFHVFKALYVPALEKGPLEAALFLQEWDQMVELEAQERGIANIYSAGKWTPKKGTEGDAIIGRPIKGESLDILRDRLGLSVSDAGWLFGMAMARWEKIAMKDWDKKDPTNVKKRGGAKLPLRNVSLALLVRVLTKYPRVCPIPAPMEATTVYQALQKVRSNIDKKRFAVMFGCEASSGHRWITREGKIGPALARTFKIFMMIMGDLEADGSKEARQNVEEFLDYWDHIVEVEASARGVQNVFSVARWKEPEKSAAKLLEKQDKSRQSKLDRAAVRAEKLLALKSEKIDAKAQARQAKLQAKLTEKERLKSEKFQLRASAGGDVLKISAEATPGKKAVRVPKKLVEEI